MPRRVSGAYSFHGGSWQRHLANEYGALVMPTFWNFSNDAPVAIYCPALSAGANNVRGWTGARELAKRGVPVLSSDLGDVPLASRQSGLPPSVGGSGQGGPGVWGNAVCMSRLDALYQLTQTVYNAHSKIILMAGSHGGAAATRWAALNPEKVACLWLGIGCVDTQDILTNNRGPAPGYRASVQQAWGLGSGLDLPDGVTGIEVASNFTFPVLSYYSTNDDVTPEDRMLAFQSANPDRIELRSMGAVGHFLQTMPYMDGVDWVLQQHAHT